MNAPAVSIVTATYNRSHVLRYTLDAALRSTFADFELIVAGDACTDDTADVVASFGDPRLRFVNLPKNCGEQSGPNNAGVAMARGRFIAFLNHDDLWLPDHLETCLAAIDGAELVFTRTLAIGGDGRCTLYGVTGGASYEPWSSPPASSWLLRRELVDAVGPWRSARTMHTVPSQEWIFRAWKRGHALRAIPKITLVALTSGDRKNSYVDREESEHALYARKLRDDPRFVDAYAAEIAAQGIAYQLDFAIARHLARAAKNVFRRAVVAAGLPPTSIRNLFLHRRKGGYIDALRRTRGLSPLAAGDRDA